MTDKEKARIETMAEEIDNRLEQANRVLGSMNKGKGYWIAEDLVNKGYRKVPQDSVVFSKEQYKEIVEQYDKDYDNYKAGEDNAKFYYENIVIPRLCKKMHTNYKIGLGKSQSWVKKLKADVEKLQNENNVLEEKVRKETAKEILSLFLSDEYICYFDVPVVKEIAEKYGVEI